MSNLDRRSFLKNSIGATLLAGLTGPRLMARLGDTAPLSTDASIFPQLLVDGGDIVAAVTGQEVWRGTSTPVWTLGGTWPAPTITVDTGEEFSARLVNNLDEPTIIHWHGLHAPSLMDGHPRNVIGPGESYDYRFLVKNRAGTYWYHPHPHMETAKQVYMGMAGFFIVHDAEERALSLPSGKYDVPFAIQDRLLLGEQKISYEPGMADLIDGLLGDAVFVNGSPTPRFSVDRGLYRIRLLNGSNARIYTLSFGDNRTFQVIGTDGGLLDRPYDVTSIVLAPAERVELLVDFSNDSNGASVEFASSGFGVSGRQAVPLSVMTFVVGPDEGWRQPFPTSLTRIDMLDPNSATKTRTFQLRMEMNMGMPHHLIGTDSYDMERVDVIANADGTEIWEFTNLTPISHPMHIHNAFFQVLTRNGAPPTDPTDFGWKDTVNVKSTESVRVIVRFGADTGLFVFHCHNLEHAGHGMMLNLELVDGAMGVEQTGNVRKMDLR